LKILAQAEDDGIPVDMTSETNSDERASFRPLAHKDGINLVFGVLLANGAMCPKCGYGTRVTSKKWARCKKCGERVERVDIGEESNGFKNRVELLKSEHAEREE
jgi:hypothetical protein